MARPTLFPLIERVRGLVHDTGASYVFSDDEIQGFLDDNRTDVIEYPLAATWQRVNGVDLCIVHTAVHGFWETDASLVDANGVTVTPSTSDYMVGRWDFNAGQQPPVYVTGKFFDLYGAAADVLEAWAAGEALSFDFDADGASYQRSQKTAHLLQLAVQYRRKSLPRTVQVRV